MHILHLFLWSIVLVSCLGAPSKLLDARGNPGTPDLEISLALTNPNTRRWHAYLVIHKPNEISEEGVILPTYEQVLDAENKQDGFRRMEFCLDCQRNTKKSYIKATTKLLHPLQKTYEDSELTEEVRKIMKRVKESKIPQVGGFQNCLDFAVEAIRLLSEEGYVTKKEYKKFKGVNDEIPPAIRKASDDLTRKLAFDSRGAKYWHSLLKKEPD
ncbi:hypothetical protein H0H93_004792 [Arthromyces matolae]|nr:hypothetical protein H0H93_004792 [Arthromyces matolae]